MSVIVENERYSRQKDIVPADRIAECRATVIGVGAIGRQVAIQLTAIGIPYLQLADFDVVEISNLASQGYMQKDLKRPKVDATAEFCREINYDLQVEVLLDRFKRSTAVGNCVFSCVDSIVTRKLIWDAIKDKVNFFCDGRMTVEVLRVITASDEKSRQYYPNTLFTSEEAQAGPCTAKTTIYCANIAVRQCQQQMAKLINRDIERFALDPAIETIVTLTDEILQANDVLNEFSNNRDSDHNFKDILQQLQLSAEIAQDKLVHLGIERIKPQLEDVVEAQRHDVCSYLCTTDKELHGKVSSVLCEGILYRGIVLKQAKVSVHRYGDLEN